jgi:hypothetical protein
MTLSIPASTKSEENISNIALKTASLRSTAIEIVDYIRMNITKTLGLFFLLLFLTSASLWSQSDSSDVVQFSGQVLVDDDSEEVLPIPFVNIYIKEQPFRGTYTDYDGFFSLVAKKGETVVFSSLGFRKEKFEIPVDLEGNRYSIFQFMRPDTINLPEAIVYPWPSREHFKIEFLQMNIDNKLEQIAMENLSADKMARLSETLLEDGRESTSYYFRRQAQTYYSYGQFKPMPIFSPIAWGKFIKALKDGDLSDKKK